MRFGIQSVIPGGDDDVAHFELENLVLRIEVDRALRALLDADAAFFAAALKPVAGLRIDHVGVRHRLRERNEDSLAICNPHVKLAGGSHRTELGAVAAGHTSAGIDIGRLLEDLDLEVADAAGHFLHFGEHQDLNILTLPHRHHLRGQNASRAIERREGLVEHGHAAADRAGALDQINLVPGFRNLQRRLNTGNAAANYQGCSVKRDGHRGLGGQIERHALHRGGDHVIGALCRTAIAALAKGGQADL